MNQRMIIMLRPALGLDNCHWIKMFLSVKAVLGRTSFRLDWRNVVYYSGPVLPECSHVPPPYEGISYNKACELRKKHLITGLPLYYKDPLMVTNGYMQWLWDEQRRRYLDFFGGIVTVSVGHCHPKINAAAIKQLETLWHVTNIYLHPSIHEYAEKLTSRLPGNLKVCFFCNSGSEANDLAVQLARLYTGTFDIISLRNAYHGDSPYSVGLCGIGKWKHAFANGFGIHHAMCPDPYQGLWGGAYCRSIIQTNRSCICSPGYCAATENYVQQLQQLLNCSVPNKIAGFIAECIQGVGGSVELTKMYLKKACELIRERGGLIIIDEVQTGFGRTGDHFWGFQGNDIVPDIVTMAKGIGNGIPLAAVVTTPEIANCLNKGLIFNTFGGNPVSCAIGSAVLDVIDEEKLMENCKHVGTHLLNSLSKLRAKYEIVGDVRGRGLMIGLELVKSKDSREPLPKSDANVIFNDLKNMGLLVGMGGANGNVLRVKPPMCITRSDADFCIAAMDEAFANFSKKQN